MDIGYKCFYVKLKTPRTCFVFKESELDRYPFIENVEHYADMIVQGFKYGISDPNHKGFLGLREGWCIVKEEQGYIPYSPEDFNAKYERYA